VDLEGPRTNVAIFYNPFKDPNLPNYNLLRDLVQEMGHEMRNVYDNPGNQGDQGNHFLDATLHSGPL